MFCEDRLRQDRRGFRIEGIPPKIHKEFGGDIERVYVFIGSETRRTFGLAGGQRIASRPGLVQIRQVVRPL